MLTLLVLLFFAGYAAALVGWGSTLRLLLRAGGPPLSPVLDAAVGLAVLVVLGGWLNLVRLATPVGVLLLLAGGVGLLAWRGWTARPDLGATLRALREGWGAAALLVLAAVVFVAATQVPAAAVNFHDDLQKYLVFPVRMLQTGTVYGSSLSGIGHETLGGQAFLQGPVVALFPLGAITGLDALLCLGLAMALAAWTLRAGGPWLAAAGAALVFAVNPLSVNVSSLYSGVCLMAALLALPGLATSGAEDAPSRGREWVEGVLLGALVALKTTFLLFAGVWGVALVVGGALGGRGARGLAGRLGRIALGAGAALLPWLAVHAPSYWRALGSPPGAPALPRELFERVFLFSFTPTLYGSGYGPYTLMAAGLVVSASMAVWRWRGLAAGPPRGQVLELSLLLLGIAVLFPVNFYVLAPALAGNETSLRYFVPLLVAVLPAGLALAERALQGGRVSWAPTAVALGLIALFASSVQDRLAQAASSGSTLAFSRLATRPAYLAYCAEALAPTRPTAVRAAQEQIPPGAALVAWLTRPYQLDFKRNPIAQVDTGVGTPWASVPAADYVLWEYQGYAVRKPESYRKLAQDVGDQDRMIGLRSLQLYRAIEEGRRAGTVLHDDGSIVAFRLGAPLRPDWRSRPAAEVLE